MSTNLIQIAPALIARSLTNPRKTFNQAKLAELAESIKLSGVMQPVLVRPLPSSRMEDTAGMTPRPTHELVMGERRWRASEMAELAEMPALVRELTDDQVLEMQMVENLQREDLEPLEEAEGYDFLMKHSSLTADQVAEKIGKSRSYVYARLKLLDACAPVRDALRAGTIDASRTLALARIPNDQLQAKALKEITRAGGWSGAEPMSYRAALEHIQREYMLRLSDARFSIKDETLLPEAGACKACPKRTGANPDLFADVKGADVCTDPPCFRKKDQAHADRELAQAQASGHTVVAGREAKQLMPHSWSDRVEGHLRLDAKEDGPEGQTLRKALSKQLASGELKPVMVANPHKGGELVAVLPVDQVGEALAKAGRTKAAEKLAAEARQDKALADKQAKEEARRALEAAWRWATLEAAWARVQVESADQSSGPKLDEVTRHIALRDANVLNQDKCKQLCKLLNLGKVAPKDGLLDWIRTTPTPGAALLLLVMFQDVEYRHWMSEEGEGNKGLFLVARTFGIDPAAVEAQTKANTRAAKASATKPAKASTPLPSAAQAQVGPKDKPKKGAAKAKPAPAKKLSAKEAQRGIADAMQGDEAAAATAAEQGAADAAQGEEVGADDGPDAPASRVKGFEVRDRVEVIGRELEGKAGAVVGFSKDVILVRLDGFTADYQFKADELKVTLGARSAWPFPSTKGSPVTGAKA